MTKAIAELHQRRMRSLVDFTASSLETRFPSPFGSAVYDIDSGELLSQSNDWSYRRIERPLHD